MQNYLGFNAWANWLSNGVECCFAPTEYKYIIHHL